MEAATKHELDFLKGNTSQEDKEHWSLRQQEAKVIKKSLRRAMSPDTDMSNSITKGPELSGQMTKPQYTRKITQNIGLEYFKTTRMEKLATSIEGYHTPRNPQAGAEYSKKAPSINDELMDHSSMDSATGI
jgi:hypothetical protein